MAVCSQIHTKHINTLCGRNAELLNVKLVVHRVTTGLSKNNVSNYRKKLHNSFPHFPKATVHNMQHDQNVCCIHNLQRRNKTQAYCIIMSVRTFAFIHYHVSTVDTCMEVGKQASSLVFFNLLKPTGHVMHHQFNIQQLYALPTRYLCVLYLSENKQRLVPLTA